MIGYKATTAYGVVESGKFTTVWTPTKRRANKYMAVLLHGSGAQVGHIDPTRLGSVQLPAFLASAGIPCITSEFAGQSWANDASMTTITNAITYGNSLFGLPAGNKVVLLGGSMGGALGIRYAGLNPTKVAAYVGYIPLTNLYNFYNALATGNATRIEIAGAWGVAANASLPAGADLMGTHGPAMKNAGIPSRIYYSSTDATVNPADQVAAGPVLGTTALNVGTNGHTEATIVDCLNYGGSTKANHMISFLKQAGA